MKIRIVNGTIPETGESYICVYLYKTEQAYLYPEEHSDEIWNVACTFDDKDKINIKDNLSIDKLLEIIETSINSLLIKCRSSEYCQICRKPSDPSVFIGHVCEDCYCNSINKNFKMKWISVKKSLPPFRDQVLIYIPNVKNCQKINVGFFETNGNFYFNDIPEDNIDFIIAEHVTHWMPLPEIPE